MVHTHNRKSHEQGHLMHLRTVQTAIQSQQSVAVGPVSETTTASSSVQEPTRHSVEIHYNIAFEGSICKPSEKVESRVTLIGVQRRALETLLFFVKDSNTNSMLVFNKLLPQLRANLGPLKVPKTDPTGPPPAPPFPDGMREQLVT